MSWNKSIARRNFLRGLGITSALPFLETFADHKAYAQDASKRLKRLIIVSQGHMALGYHRIPELAKGAYGSGDPTLMKVDAARGVRIGEFGTTPGKLGGFYEQGALKSNAKLQKEMMVVNGLAMAYSGAQGHQSDGNGSWSGGGQKGKLNTRSRFPLSGSLHQPMVTIDHVIGRKIHSGSQRPIYFGNAGWNGGGAATDESVDFNGAIQSLSGSTQNIYNSSIFDAGKKVTAAMMQSGGGATPPPVPSDPLAAMSNSDFATLMGLRFSQEERKRLLSDGRLSGNDKRSLEQYYDLLNKNLTDAEAAAKNTAAGGGGGTKVAAGCAPMSNHGGDVAAFNRLMAVAFLCDLSRIGYISVGSYADHNSVWHAGANGNSGQLQHFNKLAIEVSQIAESVAGLTDPTTGRDMLENTIVVGITNCAMAHKAYGNRDPSHSYDDFSYFSVGGSAALETGKMYDYMGFSGTKRGAVGGPIPPVNQYLQTLAAGFGATSADWSPANGKGFGPWLSSTSVGGVTVRTDDNAKTMPLPGLLKA